MAGNDGNPTYGTKLAYASPLVSFIDKLGGKQEHLQLKVITALKITFVF
jgi:hypothetical protein